MFPDEITVMYILSQVFGLIAIFFSVTGYFMRTKKMYLVCAMITNVFIALSFLFLGTYLACIGIIIALVRTIVFFIYEMEYKEVPTWVISFVFLVLIFNSAIFYTTPLDLIPMISLMMFTFGFRIRNLAHMRIFFIIPTVMFLVYNCFIFAYSDALLKTIELVAAGISITRYYTKKKKTDAKKIKHDLEFEEFEEINE